MKLPDFSKIHVKKNKRYIALISQRMFMYKLNLQNLDENLLIGSKITYFFSYYNDAKFKGF